MCGEKKKLNEHSAQRKQKPGYIRSHTQTHITKKSKNVLSDAGDQQKHFNYYENPPYILTNVPVLEAKLKYITSKTWIYTFLAIKLDDLQASSFSRLNGSLYSRTKEPDMYKMPDNRGLCESLNKDHKSFLARPLK